LPGLCEVPQYGVSHDKDDREERDRKRLSGLIGAHRVIAPGLRDLQNLLDLIRRDGEQLFIDLPSRAP
jgi:hypothetical protein